MKARRAAVLLVTETSDLAADLLVLGARDRGIALVRFNQDDFPLRAQIVWQSDGEIRFHCEGQDFSGGDVSGAWFRRVPHREQHTAAFVDRESQAFLGGVWATAPWFWMNVPSAAVQAEHKLLQLLHARRLGFTVPDTLATNCPDEGRRFVSSRGTIAKTLAGGRLVVGGIRHAVFTTAITVDDIGADEAVQVCPVIFQSHIETLFDLRVTVVGEQVFAARIIVQDRTVHDLDWRHVATERVRYERHVLSAELRAKCVELVAAMGLSYGALDFVVTSQGEEIFLELNPAGQWGWIEQALGLPITDAILDRLNEGQPCA